MSKVLVDRALLENVCDVVDSLECASGFALGSCEELRELLAHPAEAEGVEVIAYATPNEDGGWQMLFFDEKEAIQYVDDEPPAPLVLQSAHLAALSAVTAERDGLAAARMAYANEFAPDENGDPDVGNVHANIRALKAERDRLREAFGECIQSLHDEMLQSYGGQKPDDMHPVTRRNYDRDMAEIAEYRAAIAASINKESKL